MLNLIQLLSAIILVACILLQQRGSGLGMAFGGSNSVYRTKRGAEKFIFVLTIISAVVFFSSSFLNIYLKTNTPVTPASQTETQETQSDTPAATESTQEPTTDDSSNQTGTNDKETQPATNNSDLFNLGETKDQSTTNLK